VCVCVFVCVCVCVLYLCVSISCNFFVLFDNTDYVASLSHALFLSP